MHIIHGTWLPKSARFAVWAEDPNLSPQYKRGRRGRVAPHPLAASSEAVSDIVRRLTTDAFDEPTQIEIWLPGHGKRVSPSPEALAAGADPLTDEVDLLCWEVEAVCISATDALDLFLQYSVSLLRDVRLGGDARFWEQVALLVMNLLVEGRYLPQLDQNGGQFTATWRAIPDPDLRRQLVAKMPRLCQAASADPEAPETPETLLDTFLDHTIDLFIREMHESRQLSALRGVMQGLTGMTHVLTGTVAQNKVLMDAWNRWSAGLGAVDQSGLRVGLRLRDPGEDGETWQVDYLLQAVDDPSLIIDAMQVWQAGTGALDYLEHRFDRPGERLLTGLGRASHIFPPIERSLRQARPIGVTLDRDEAYQFLTEALPVLETSGFAVQVPNWWGRRARLRAKATIKGPANETSSFLTRDALLRYEWQMALGDETLSRDEFEALVALKQPLVRHKGEWIALDPDQIDAARKFFEQAAGGDLTLQDALKANATATAIDGIEVEETEIEGWLEDVFEQLYQPDTIPPAPPPSQLQATLRPYQQRGFSWLAQMRHMGLGACLADDMGLGKTLQTITLWLYERDQLGITAPALLVCPTSVVGNWRHELRKFAPSLRIMSHHGPDRLQGEAFAAAVENVDVVLTSYALLRRDQDTFQGVEWSDVVLDEAQNIKNPSTKQAQAARSLPGAFKLALTGTPVENRLSELWSIFQFLNPGYLGSQKAFRSNFALPVERYGDPEAAATLRQLTAPFILRRVKTDTAIIQDLPEKFENKAYCTLSTEQVTLYEAAVRETMEAIEAADEDMSRRGNILRMLTHLKQICNHPAHFLKEGETAPLVERSGKLDRLTDIVDEVYTNGERLLIFTQYREMGDLLQTHLRQHLVDEVLFLHGGAPSQARDEMVRRFQASSGPPVFILSLKAGGTGLTLTAANHVVHFDRWYNPAVENQATDRAYRIGQTRAVQVHKLICLGTLEERIDEMIEQKQAVADAVIDAGESWISELDNDDLRDLVSLRREALEG